MCNVVIRSYDAPQVHVAACCHCVQPMASLKAAVLPRTVLQEEKNRSFRVSYKLARCVRCMNMIDD